MKYISYRMLHRVSKAVCFGTIALIVFLFLFVFVYENIDSYNYWAFGEFLRTGIYPFIWPFVYSRPTTISPPLLSALLALTSQVPRGDILFHAVQLALFAGTSVCTYLTLKFFTSKPIALIASCLIAWIPGSIIYSSYVLTETGMQFFLSLYCLLFAVFIVRKRMLYLSLSIFVGLVMGLWKYSFLVYGLLSLAILVYVHPKKFIAYLFPAIGLLIIVCWIFYNHAITGVWGLSDTKSLYAYSMFVSDGHVLPSRENPSMQRFRTYVPENVSPYEGYWSYLPYILPKVNYSWPMTEEIIGGIGKAAIQEQPLRYLTTAVRIFFETHMHGSPYWKNLSSFGTVDPSYPLYCDYLGTMKFCTPIIMTGYTYRVWNTFVKWSDWFYAFLFPVWSVFIFFPMLGVSLFSKNKLLRWIGILFLVGRIPMALTAFAESRYLVPFYPLMALITVFGMKQSVLWFKKR